MTHRLENYPDQARLSDLYNRSILLHGGNASQVKPGCVEGALGNAIIAAQYRTGDEVPDPLLVAAFLCRSLARNHCYSDGNKRLAWLSLLEVLWCCAELTVDADADEAEEMVVGVTTGALDVDDIVRWLSDDGRLVEAKPAPSTAIVPS